MAPESLLGTHRLPLNLFQLKTFIVNRITLVHVFHQHGHGSFYSSKLDSRASPPVYIVSESFCVTVLVNMFSPWGPHGVHHSDCAPLLPENWV